VVRGQWSAGERAAVMLATARRDAQRHEDGYVAIWGVRPANRVLDGRGLIPPKGGHHHGPRQSAGRAEGTAVATLDR
jgi:hypothetical protein